MPRLPYIFKYLLLIVLVVLCACDDIPRDNILDPKNPGSYRAQITAIEAFVNLENDKQYNQYMLTALNTIKERYRKKIAILQFHRNVGDYSDSLSLRENEILYENYIDFLGSEKGAPDIFINGPLTRIKGASSAEAAVERIEEQLQQLLLENSFFTLEPSIKRENGRIDVSVTLARLGSLAAENIYLRLIITEQIDSHLLRHVVRQVQVSNLIPALEPGEKKTTTFPHFNLNSSNNLRAVIMIISNDNLSIMQSIEVALP